MRWSHCLPCSVKSRAPMAMVPELLTEAPDHPEDEPSMGKCGIRPECGRQIDPQIPEPGRLSDAPCARNIGCRPAKYLPTRGIGRRNWSEGTDPSPGLPTIPRMGRLWEPKAVRADRTQQKSPPFRAGLRTVSGVALTSQTCGAGWPGQQALRP